MSFKFRPQRGGYVQSMSEIKTFDDWEQLSNYIANEFGAELKEIRSYQWFDARNGWNTHIVLAQFGFMSDTISVVGFTDGPVP